MNWLKKLMEKLFSKSKIKQLEEPKIVNIDNKADFRITLNQQANMEADDRNGYKIMPNIKLEDMV